MAGTLMTYHKLRIAWSVFWGLACVLLIFLWVRSHFYWEQLNFGITSAHVLVSNSEDGEFVFSCYHINPKRRIAWRVLSFPPHQSLQPSLPVDAITGISFRFSSKQIYFAAPYWLLSSFAGGLAAASWLPWRFSLRTLLIATTLVAVVLALLVWAARK